MGIKIKSDFLFAQPSFLSGAARVMDLTGRFDEYNESANADVEALAADWHVVGEDLRNALQSGVDELLAAI